MKRLILTFLVAVVVALAISWVAAPDADAYPQPGPRPCDPPIVSPTVYQHMTAQVPNQPDPTWTTSWWRTRDKTVVVCRIWDHNGDLWLKTTFRFVTVTAWEPRCTANPGPRETTPECERRDA